MTAN
ncbi:hypothetical protein MC885_015053 [Smutsia gigantea]|jgi:hypothetical protein